MFDMGGVLVELGPLPELLGAPDLDPAEFWRRWLRSDAVRAFELGRTDLSTFAVAAVVDLGLSLDPEEFARRFVGWPRGLFPGAADLVRSVRAGVTVGIVSNTNAAHWRDQIDAEVVRSLGTHHFLSFELGLIKPDADYFDHLVDELGGEPGRILFLDDNLINVEGARSRGLIGEVVKGPGEARAVLERFELLED